MSDDWKPGDIALCTRSSKRPWCWGRSPVIGPTAGEVLEVKAVNIGPKSGRTALFFSEYVPFPGWLGYHSPYFVKITPEEADEFDKETIDLYNKSPKVTEKA